MGQFRWERGRAEKHFCPKMLASPQPQARRHAGSGHLTWILKGSQKLKFLVLSPTRAHTGRTCLRLHACQKAAWEHKVHPSWCSSRMSRGWTFSRWIILSLYAKTNNPRALWSSRAIRPPWGDPSALNGKGELTGLDSRSWAWLCGGPFSRPYFKKQLQLRKAPCLSFPAYGSETLLSCLRGWAWCSQHLADIKWKMGFSSEQQQLLNTIRKQNHHTLKPDLAV